VFLTKKLTVKNKYKSFLGNPFYCLIDEGYDPHCTHAYEGSVDDFEERLVSIFTRS
jgi:hypothetical protein